MPGVQEAKRGRVHAGERLSRDWPIAPNNDFGPTRPGPVHRRPLVREPGVAHVRFLTLMLCLAAPTAVFGIAPSAGAAVSDASCDKTNLSHERVSQTAADYPDDVEILLPSAESAVIVKSTWECHDFAQEQGVENLLFTTSLRPQTAAPNGAQLKATSCEKTIVSEMLAEGTGPAKSYAAYTSALDNNEKITCTWAVPTADVDPGKAYRIHSLTSLSYDWEMYGTSGSVPFTARVDVASNAVLEETISQPVCYSFAPGLDCFDIIEL